MLFYMALFVIRMSQTIFKCNNKTISNYGAVSSETVKEMLMGLCSQAKSRVLTIAISGLLDHEVLKLNL